MKEIGEAKMSRLTGKTAIVTGASKGIGAGIAKSLAAEGARVVVNYATSREGADRIVQEIKENGGKAVAIQADVSKRDEVQRLFKQSREAFGTLDVLVNNAGVFEFAPLQEVTEAEFHREFNINVLGPLFAIKESLNAFRLRRSVINIGSAVSRSPVANSVVYSATKGALDTITRGLAKELGPRGIRVNSIAPGGVATEGTERIGVIGSDFEKQIVANTPLGRFGKPEDIATIAVFLASDESGWLTGERIEAAGGYR
jgi:3-oxoacyl-[acyl-carrier protein] reductase